MVNYPHKLSKKSSSPIQRKQSVNFANRGMTFEKMINESNQYYLSRGLAVIHKKADTHPDCKGGLSSSQSGKDC